METWSLRDGPVVPAAVVSLALDLESRGIKLAGSGEKLIVAGPDGPPQLSEWDRQQITIWKRHLLALVAYCEVEHGAHLFGG